MEFYSTVVILMNPKMLLILLLLFSGCSTGGSENIESENSDPKKEGLYIEKFPNGTTKTEGHYEKGKKTGLWISYREKDTLYADIAFYDNDTVTGTGEMSWYDSKREKIKIEKIDYLNKEPCEIFRGYSRKGLRTNYSSKWCNSGLDTIINLLESGDTASFTVIEDGEMIIDKDFK